MKKKLLYVKVLIGVIISSVIIFLYSLNSGLIQQPKPDNKSTEWKSAPCPNRMSYEFADSLKQILKQKEKVQ